MRYFEILADWTFVWLSEKKLTLLLFLLCLYDYGGYIFSVQNRGTVHVYNGSIGPNGKDFWYLSRTSVFKGTLQSLLWPALLYKRHRIYTE